MIYAREEIEKWLSKAKIANVIVFDLDGTLVNSDVANFLSYKAAVTCILSEHIQMNFDPEVRMTREILERIIPYRCRQKISEIVEQKESIYHHYLSETILNNNLIEIIDRSKGKEIILATSCRKHRADMLLDYYDLADKFTSKIYGDVNVPRDKYTKLIPEIMKENKSILIFENDESAIESAISCGISEDCIINVCG